MEDESALREAYATWLGHHDVRTVATGSDALEAVDGTVDLLILDRQLPDLRGTAVVDHLRRRGLDPGLIVLTGVARGVDDVGDDVDRYLVKPISAEVLREAVRAVLDRRAYGRLLDEYFDLASRKAELEVHDRPPGAAHADRVAEVTGRMEDVRDRLDTLATRLGPDWEAVFRAGRIGRNGCSPPP